MKYHFFYGGPFSQWYPSSFIIDGVTYNCAEQYMMAQKALMFGDKESHAKIMLSTNPAQQKFFGRLVDGFDKVIWETKCRDIVFKGNFAKFTQNQDLLKYLMDTGYEELVEASPTDTIWGIGLAQSDPRITDKKQWRGTNWLGEAIMKVREILRTEEVLREEGMRNGVGV